MADVVNIAERKPNRPPKRKYTWARRLKADPRIDQHRNVGGRFIMDLAELLASFGSFEQEGVYSGRDYLAVRLGVLPRQVSRGTAALKAMGYLDVQRRGTSSNLVVPMLDGERLYPAPGATLHSTTRLKRLSERQLRCVPKDSHDVSGETAAICLLRPPNLLNLNTETENQEQTAPHPPEQSDYGSKHIHANSIDNVGRDETTRSLAIGALDSEVLHPSRQLSFADFWNCSRSRSDSEDKPGPARLAFDRLSDFERTEIASVVERDGRIDLGGMWTVVWLRTKAWREAPLRRSGIAGALDQLDRFDDLTKALKVEARQRVVLKPGTPDFAREFERRRQAGEDVSAMEGAIRRNGLCTIDIPIGQHSG